MSPSYDSRFEGLNKYQEAFQAEHRTAVAQIADACRRQRQLAAMAFLAGVDTAQGITLPESDVAEYHPDSPEKVDEPRRAAQRFERDGRAWLRLFRDTYAPGSRMQLVQDTHSQQKYYRLTAYDETGSAEWAIAERDDNGNATYLWRRDLSQVDPDTAFSTTRGNARRNGCIKVAHLPGFGDSSTEAAAAERHVERIAEALSAPAEDMLATTHSLGRVAARQTIGRPALAAS